MNLKGIKIAKTKIKIKKNLKKIKISNNNKIYILIINE